VRGTRQFYFPAVVVFAILWGYRFLARTLKIIILAVFLVDRRYLVCEKISEVSRLGEPKLDGLKGGGGEAEKLTAKIKVGGVGCMAGLLALDLIR